MSYAACSERSSAFEICFCLLRRTDKCTDDFLFFADEGGSWQVGVDWTKVLPAWFECLSPVAGPEEYASRVFGVVNAFIRCGRDMHIMAAKRVATADQRKALEQIESLIR